MGGVVYYSVNVYKAADITCIAFIALFALRTSRSNLSLNALRALWTSYVGDCCPRAILVSIYFTIFVECHIAFDRVIRSIVVVIPLR